MSVFEGIRPDNVAGLVLLLACGLVSALLCRLALAYAQRRGLADAPGRRRSHLQTTARGGGIAFVLVVLVLSLLLPGLPGGPAFGLGLAAVAAVGWWDDHRPLSVRLRLAVHFAAALLLVLSLRGLPGDAFEGMALLLALLWVAALLNFWNFMDGINGLASVQAVIAAGLYAGLAMAAGLPAVALLGLGLAAAVMGFLPWNFPRARMFMGDVGSGPLGYALAALALMLEPIMRHPWPLLLPVLPMLLDASLTLLRRMALKRRWYAPHREHLYQWWVRRGASHARVTLAYALFSLVFVLPLLMASLIRPDLGLPITVGAYAAASGLWLWARARLRRRWR